MLMLSLRCLKESQRHKTPSGDVRADIHTLRSQLRPSTEMFANARLSQEWFAIDFSQRSGGRP
jgi:hypothetical protein